VSDIPGSHDPGSPDSSSPDPSNVRPFVPVTDDAVPAMLREALDLAVAGKLRGIVVLLAFHDRTPMVNLTAGDLSIADAVLLLESWKHEMLHHQRTDPAPP
jgi:hypothetical protein